MNVWPDTLPYPLVTPKVTSSPRSVQTLMETGRIRKRRFFEVPLDVMALQWNFTLDEFGDFKSFFEDTLNNGSQSFLLDVFGSERELAFVDGKYSFSRSDNLVSVAANVTAGTYWILEEGLWRDTGQWGDTNLWTDGG